MLDLERIQGLPESSYLRRFLEMTNYLIALDVSTNLKNITDPYLYNVITSIFSIPYVSFSVSLYNLVEKPKANHVFTKQPGNTLT